MAHAPALHVGPRDSPKSPSLNPRLVHTAQPSPYWTGRFVALQDRFRAELLATVARPDADRSALLFDDDNTRRRVVLHLQAMCVTEEARQSLRDWQRVLAPPPQPPRGGERRSSWLGRLLGRPGG